MAADDRSRSEAAKQRRQDQLQRWLRSETDRKGTELRERPLVGGGRRAKVRFAQGAVFMAACSAGDREEVSELLRQGADINHANVDGLTALHQACIDENMDMVQFLVENGSEVNRGDNEGWTPLHAAASCGFIQIAKYLIDHGALVGAVNSEAELPLDVATDDAMEKLLKAEIKKQGVDMESARHEEERVMLRDAMAIISGHGTLTPHPITGATALHVAAAKGYMEVMKVLLQCGLDVDSRDSDGWTPLHAAAHWGQEEACTMLADNMCDMAAVNIVGQTPLDVADENLVDVLEELQKKQNVMRSERQNMSPPSIIETGPSISTAPARQRRTSISRMSSKEKISLHERERHPPPPLQNTPNEDEEEEIQAGPQGPSGASSSSSSEEDSDSESDAESEKAKTREIINNKRNSSALAPISTAAGTTATQIKKPDPGKPPTVEAPGSWRTSLRKMNTEPGRQGNNPELTPQTMTRSASSPRLSSESDAKETRLARVPPTPSRRLFSIADSSPPVETSSSGLTRSSSYTRRFNSQSEGDITGHTPGLPRSSSYGKKLDDSTVTSVTTGNTFGLSRLNSLVAQRLAQEQADKKDTLPTTTSNAVTMTTGEQETKQRRKSYLTPVRDEEAEAQRKARSRHARQSRRSTQGVTLTDLQEAEKTIKTEQKEREKKKEDDEKDGKGKKGEEGEVSWRSRIANLQKSDLLGLTTPAGAPRPHTVDGRDAQEGGAGLAEERLNRERRTTRVQRRTVQQTSESDDNELSGEEVGDRGPDSQSQATRNSSRSDGPLNDRIIRCGSDTKDYKRLFEEVSLENSQLQSQLQDTQRTMSQTRADLEKATQRQERFSDCSALLELEKKERRILERRVAELEEELKVLGDLRADNQRLKDENGALIRVISKLSK